MPRRTSIAAFLAASTMGTLVCATRPSAAVDPEELYQSALADMKARSFASACPKFAEARRLKPDSLSALQGLALCYDKLGRSASAWAKYRELAVEFKAVGDARAQAAMDRAQQLALTLSTVTIKVAAPDTPGLIIRLDHDEVPKVMFGTKVNVDPGEHVIEATAPGYGVWQTKLASGDRNDAREVNIPTLERLPVSTPPPAVGTGPSKPALIAGGVVSGAAAIVGGVLLGVSAQKSSSASTLLAKLSKTGGCPPASSSNLTGDCANLKSDLDARSALGSAGVWMLVGAGTVGLGTLIYGLTGSRGARSAVVVAPVVTADGGALLIKGSF